MTSKRIVGAAAVAVAGMTAASFAGTATAGAAPAKDANAAAVHQSTQKPSEVAAYWTKSRMLAAREVAVPQVTRSATAAVPQQTSKLGATSAAGSACSSTHATSTRPAGCWGRW